MNLSVTEDQFLIRNAARQFLTDWIEDGRLRKAVDEEGVDRDAWRTLTGELGLGGILAPESLGGTGFGHIERAIVMEEMGAHLFVSPFFSSCCLASDVLMSVEDTAYLPDVISGKAVATVAFDVAVKSGGRIKGNFRNVCDGQHADLMIVVAGGELFAIPLDVDGVTVTPVKTIDPTRSLADVTIDLAMAEVVRIGDTSVLDTALDHSRIALAAEQVGIAQRALDMTVKYASERIQFGRTVSSFQAVKHRAADMMVAVESARSAAYYAAHIADAASEELAEAASIAKAWCSDAAYKVTADAIQLHGGIGFTWEYDLHFYFKRARAGRMLLGSPERMYERLAELVVGEVA